jgi:hypothetical protein
MQLARPVVARAPGAFGRGQIRQLCAPQPVKAGWSVGSDAKLFATTFLAGFMFVSILIG